MKDHLAVNGRTGHEVVAQAALVAKQVNERLDRVTQRLERLECEHETLKRRATPVLDVLALDESEPPG